MKIEVVPCLSDNYAYLAYDEATSIAVIVDPSESVPVIARVGELRLMPVAVLCTHHHGDHVAGVLALLEAFPGLDIWAHESNREQIPRLTRTVSDGDQMRVGPLSFSAMHVPGHTLGDVVWHAPGLVFTGDALFAGGCGRVFEGTPSMLHGSLRRIATTFSSDTKVYCGHEYTQANLRFAAYVEPSNPSIQQRRDRVKAVIETHHPSVPSTIGEELLTNPFLRCQHPDVAQFAHDFDGSGPDPDAVFAAVRVAKNQFRR